MANDKSDLELHLLNRSLGATCGPSPNSLEWKQAPLFTHDAFRTAPGLFPNRGLFGSILRQSRDTLPLNPQDKRLYVNNGVPYSAVICGVQGSGKSHTVSCLLESCLLRDDQIGKLSTPSAGLVFHFDDSIGEKPCEAAYLASPDKNSLTGSCVSNVTVLVSPSNLNARRKVYAPLKHVEVRPLHFAEGCLTPARMLSMMGCDDIERMPMYLHCILSILRAIGADQFDYGLVKQRLQEAKLKPADRVLIDLRLNLLDSYLRTDVPSITSCFKSGHLVIVDLTDPYLDASSAAMLFDMVLGLFMEWRPQAEKVLVLDDAHKYLTTRETTRLMKSITSIIRQQRELSTRVIISTQEPTAVPATILDLISIVICHKISSPSWCQYLKRHIGVAETSDSQDGETSLSIPWFEELVELHTGEALVFSSAAVVLDTSSDESQASLRRLGVGHFKIQVRPRITGDIESIEDAPVKVIKVKPRIPSKERIQWVRALFDYKSTHPNDLEFKQGSRFILVERSSEDWWTGEHKGRRGVFPKQYVTLDNSYVSLPSPKMGQGKQTPFGMVRDLWRASPRRGS